MRNKLFAHAPRGEMPRYYRPIPTLAPDGFPEKEILEKKKALRVTAGACCTLYDDGLLHRYFTLVTPSIS